MSNLELLAEKFQERVDKLKKAGSKDQERIELLEDVIEALRKADNG